MIPFLISDINVKSPNRSAFFQSLDDFISCFLFINVSFDLSDQMSFNFIQHVWVLFVSFDSIFQSIFSGFPSHCLLVSFSWLLSTFFDKLLQLSCFLGKFVTSQERLCHFSDVFNLRLNLFQLFAQDYLIVIFKKINSLHFLFLSGSTGINFSHSFSEILSFISMENLILEVWPIILCLWFTINCDNNPFKNLMSLGFSIINVHFFESLGINSRSILYSFFPFSEILLFVCLDLFFVLIFFIAALKISFINTYFALQICDLFIQLRNCVRTFCFVRFKFRKSRTYSQFEIFYLAGFSLNHINISVDKLLCEVSQWVLKSGKFMMIVFQLGSNLKRL